MDRPPVDNPESHDNSDPFHHDGNAKIASEIDLLLNSKQEYPSKLNLPDQADEVEYMDPKNEKPPIMIHRLYQPCYTAENRLGTDPAIHQDLPDTFTPPILVFSRHYAEHDEQTLQMRIRTKNGDLPPFVRTSHSGVFSISESFMVDKQGNGVRTVSIAPYQYWDTALQEGIDIKFTPDELLEVPFEPDTKTDEHFPLSDEERALLQKDLEDIRNQVYERAR